MGVADLMAAFNAAAEPRFTCARATLSYERGHGIESQRLRFHGTGDNGAAFDIASDPVRPNGDLLQAARDTAARLLALHKAPSG